MGKAKKGILFVLSAPSGCGKTTIVKRLIARDEHLRRSISATERLPRADEEEGRDYYFLSRPAFIERRRRGEFLEWAKVFGHLYGTLKEPVLEHLRQGFDVILAIDVQGAKKVRKELKSVSLFILPPTLEDLKKRLQERGTDSKEEIQRRLLEARKEMREAKHYDYTMTNRTLEETVEKVREIIHKERRERSVTKIGR